MVVKNTILSHVAGSRSFEVSGDEMFMAAEGTLSRPYFGWSVYDGGTANDYSYAVTIRAKGSPPTTATALFSGTLATLNQDSAKTIGPFSATSQILVHDFQLYRGAVYIVTLATPLVDAPEAERVMLTFRFFV